MAESEVASIVNEASNNENPETNGEKLSKGNGKSMSESNTVQVEDIQSTNVCESEQESASKVHFDTENIDDKNGNDAVVEKVDLLNGATATESNASDISVATPTEVDKKKTDGENPVIETSKLTAKKQPKIQSGKDLKVSERALEDRANCLSVWLLSYLTPLLQLGNHKLLDQDDVGVPPDADRAERVYSLTYAIWQKQAVKCREDNKKMHEAYQQKLDACGNNDVKRAKLLAKPPVGKDPSIAGSIVRAFGVWPIVLSIIYYIISALLGFVPVMILNDLVKYFQQRSTNAEWNGFAPPWVEVAALGVVPVLVSLLQTRNQVIMSHCAVFVRTAVSTMLYRKALRVSAAGRAKTSTGQVVNMMSNDTAQLQRFLQFIGMTLVAPLQIVIALVLIYGQVGNATWVGVGYMIFLAPVNTIIFSIVAKQRRNILQYSDQRVKMMNEILAGIRIIKFYAWERPFGSEIGRMRSKEVEGLTKLAYTSAIGFSLILLSAPIIQPILVFLTYVSIQDKPMDAATAFTTVALFNIMRFPFAFLPMGLLQYIQSKIALRRLERYLDLPELAEYVEDGAPPDSVDPSEKENGSVTIRSGTFSWVDPDAKPIRDILEMGKKKKKKEGKTKKGAKEESASDVATSSRMSTHSIGTSTHSDTLKGPTITLQDLDLHIPSGSLVAVVGSVGAGKSSLLSAILGEMEPIKDSKVYVPRPSNCDMGFISYCSQTPWIVNDTLRGNVLFGREYDEERYEEVIEACALVDDIAILPAGDFTEIGERGINLSGGQKARVSLARALYSRATRLLLLDDPLSAVDAHVGEHIFAKAINGRISNGLTRVLVTHHVHLLSRCDQVIVLEHGRIKHIGSYSELVSNGVDFAGAIDVSKVSKSVPAITEGGDMDNGTSGGGAVDEIETIAQRKPEDEIMSDKAKAKMKQSGKQLLSEEEREVGDVSSSAYWRYASAGGVCLVVWTFIVQGLGRACEIMGGFWLALWADRSVQAVFEKSPLTDGQTNFYVGIYGLFGLLGVLGLTVRSIFVAWHRLGASVKLHDDLTARILRAPVAFFDVTPTGRILNRFSADMDKIDLELTQSLSQGISTIFNVLGSIATIVIATKGTFLVAFAPMSVLYYMIQKWFRKTSTELQRINSIANSPIFADFSMTLSGTSTIRAYGKEQMFFTHCKSSFDTMNASYILIQLVNCWLGLRLDVLGGLIGAFIGGVAVATAPYNLIPAGWLGFALSSSIEVTNFLKFGIRMIATIEAQMNSVERVLYYTDNVEIESDEYTSKDPVPSTWPQGGEIVFDNASMRYRDGPLVLKDLSVTIRPGEKVGVCGRTGSGKSSLMIALFRISEIESDGGTIHIDGYNTTDLGTTTLRSNLSIIPQDPVIFSNTVRYNLDPFVTSTDDEIWDVLDKVQMSDVIGALPNGLKEEVAEGGENFSQGQRQLLCIARSLLRKPKILVMDEATASIDNATDTAVQEMIRLNFKDATVLTIAHRLNTIMDSDRVLVLDDGRVAEFDTPENLLANPDSLFKAMTDKSRAAKNANPQQS